MKKINLFIIGFGLGFTLFYNIGFIFLIPIYFYFAKKDIKSLVLIMIGSTVSVLIFNQMYILSLLFLEVVIFFVVILFNSLKQKNKLIYIIYSVSII